MPFSVEKFYYKSANQKNNIAAYIYSPQQQPKAIVQICHGMREYFNRYNEFAEFLTQHNILVCGNDHLGHGNSVENNKYGFFSEENGADYLIEDVYTLTKNMQKRYPGTPYFLLGHSMGSFIARNYYIKYADALDGLIISGTGGRNPLIGFAKHLSEKHIKRWGADRPDMVLENLIFGSYNKRIKKKRTESDWTTRDNNIVDAYVKDARCSFPFSTSAFRDLFTLHDACNCKQWYSNIEKEKPILFFSGEEDPLGSYGKGIRAIYKNLQKAGVKDVQMLLYPGGRHEMLNEINRQDVYNDILHWIEEKLPSNK